MGRLRVRALLGSEFEELHLSPLLPQTLILEWHLRLLLLLLLEPLPNGLDPLVFNLRTCV